jgi:hypothetical protein
MSDSTGGGVEALEFFVVESPNVGLVSQVDALYVGATIQARDRREWIRVDSSPDAG